MEKTNPCVCGSKPSREVISLSYGSSNDVWQLICRKKGHHEKPVYDKEFDNCWTEEEAVRRWNQILAAYPKKEEK